MSATEALIKNFFIQSFQKKGAWVLFFVAPVAGFLALFLLIRMNAGAEIATAQSLGIILFFIMIQGAFITGLTIKDREGGVMIRLKTAPFPFILYTLSNGIAGFFILSLQILFTVGILSIFLHSFLGFVLIKMIPLFLLFGITSIGFGFLISSLSENSAQWGVISNFSIIITSIISGCFFPSEFMSPVMKGIAKVLPQRWAMDALEKLFEGKPWSSLWLELALLLLFAAFFMALSATLGRKRA